MYVQAFVVILTFVEPVSFFSSIYTDIQSS